MMETAVGDRGAWKIKEKKGDFILSADIQQEELNLEHPNSQKRPVLKQIYHSQRALNAFLVLQLPYHHVKLYRTSIQTFVSKSGGFTIKLTVIITADVFLRGR